MSAVAEPTPILLWPEGAPGSESWTHEERKWVNPQDGAKVLRNVARPTLIPCLPDPSVANGTAVIVCPGGAFTFLAYEHEGTQVAEWLVERGIAAFILHYRVRPTAPSDDDFQRQMREDMSDRARFMELTKDARQFGVDDGKRALQIVRERAAEWGIAADRIGIMGFSAGGTVTLGVAFDPDSRPDFAAPIYPAPWQAAVPADAPPLFLACASDDVMAVGTSLPLFSAWRDAGRSVELHIFSQGGHGFGMRERGLPSDHWIELFGNWLVGQGLVAKQG